MFGMSGHELAEEHGLKQWGGSESTEALIRSARALPMEDAVVEMVKERVDALAVELLAHARERIADRDLRWAVLRHALNLDEQATV